LNAAVLNVLSGKKDSALDVCKPCPTNRSYLSFSDVDSLALISIAIAESFSLESLQ